MGDVTNTDGCTKEVYFDVYCPICKYEKESETEMPCRECLENGWNWYSHKPIMWEEK